MYFRGILVGIDIIKCKWLHEIETKAHISFDIVKK